MQLIQSWVEEDTMVHLTSKARGALKARMFCHDVPTFIPQSRPAYIRVLGRVYALMPKALTNYLCEYGLSPEVPYELDECLNHIAGEMEIALSREGKPVGIRGQLFQYESSSLIFKLSGSKVMNIRISLRTSPFADGETASLSGESYS